MIPETEAQIYDFITKDGKSLDSIRKNTQTLRDQLADEEEKRVHALITLDPQNKDRHERESARISEEKNQKLDEVLMRIAQNTPVELPLHREAMLEASKKLTGSRKPASYVKTFVLTYVGSSILMFILQYWVNSLGVFGQRPDLRPVTTYDDSINFWLRFGVPFFLALMVTIGKNHK